MSFFGGGETVTPPWLDPTAEDTPQGHKQFNISDDLQTGTLADYLGVPLQLQVLMVVRMNLTKWLMTV